MTEFDNNPPSYNQPAYIGPDGTARPMSGASWQQPPTPPKKKHTVRNIILGVLALLVIGIVIGAASGGSDNKPASGQTSSSAATVRNADAKKDVKLVSCGVDQFKFGAAKLTTKNTTSKAANYIITVAFNAPNGDQIGTGTAVVQTLQPGQSSTQTAQGLDELPAGTTCVVTDVQRFNS